MSLAAKDTKDLYLASVDDLITIFYFLELQEMRCLPRNIQKPYVERRLSG